MCGIAGAVSSCQQINIDVVERMNVAMLHRGPDAGGIYRSPDGRCVLGNRRLAIIDLSPAGEMPMTIDGGRYWITYNGELYNFRELRDELTARGHRFHSMTDTEVVLRLFCEYGEAAVQRLNGMFAFAIWDETEHTLWLARDRVGIKPLYYIQAGDTWLFASEVRALLASGLVEPVADGTAIGGYLTLGAVPDDRTIIAGVRSLPPAHTAKLVSDRMTVRRYWSHEQEMCRSDTLADTDVEDAVREGLKSTVERQLVSDVPLGLFLSGGMDSGTLAALMRAAGHDAIRSVSVIFNEQDYDERSAARAVAERFGTRHEERLITIQDVATELDTVIASMDQPTSDGINTYFVSKAARQSGLTVALSGLGADELFGGYPTFSTVPRARRILNSLASLPARHALAEASGSLPLLPYRARKLAAWLDEPASLEIAYASVRGLSLGHHVDRLARGFAFDSERYLRSAVDHSGLDDIDAVSLLETRVYMHNQLLRDTDMMSMAHSLEVRVPFLDNEILDLAARARHLLANGRKNALSRARSRYFPIGMPVEPKKGFLFPLDRWLRGPLSEMVDERLSNPRSLESRETRRLLKHFRAGHIHWTAVWAPTVLEHWLSVHNIQPPREAPCESTSS